MGIDSVEFFTMEHVLWVFGRGCWRAHFLFTEKLWKVLRWESFQNSSCKRVSSIHPQSLMTARTGTCAPERVEIIQTHFPALIHGNRESISPCRLLSHILCLSVERTFHCSSIALSYQLPSISRSLHQQSGACTHLNVVFMFFRIDDAPVWSIKGPQRPEINGFLVRSFVSQNFRQTPLNSSLSTPRRVITSLWLQIQILNTNRRRKLIVCSTKGT